MKKKFLRCISLLLAVIMLAEMLPTAWFASFLPRVYAADTAAPTETYTVPVAAPTDNTITTDIPPTIIDDTDTDDEDTITGNAAAAGTPTIDISDIINTSKPECSEDDAHFIAILKQSAAFSALSAADAAFLVDYTHIPASSFSEMEAGGISLWDSVTYGTLAIEAECPVSTVLALDLSLDAVRRITQELATLQAVLRAELSGTELSRELKQYILYGHSCVRVLNAYGVSQVFGISMAKLLNFDIAMPAELSASESQKIEAFSESLDIAAAPLAEYAIKNGLSAEEIESHTNEITQKYSDILLTPQSTGGDSGEAAAVQNPYVGAPYTYSSSGNEKTALNSGSLVYENTDYVLPGINGLDLEIARRYDSQSASLGTPDADVVAHYETVCCVIVSGTAYSEVPGYGRGRWPAQDIPPIEVGEFTSYMEAEKVRAKYETTVRKENFQGDVDLIIEFTAKIVPKNVGVIYELESTTKPNDYFQKLYGLGCGWRLNFSSIEISGNQKYLHLAAGETYEIKSDSSGLHLKDYPLDDLTLTKQSNLFSNGSTHSEYCLTYQDGKREYFDSEGKLIGIQDRNGNTITLVHTKENGYPHIAITDTLGRETIISGTSTESGHRMTVQLSDGITLIYELLHEDNAYILASYQDAAGNKTHYSYEKSSTNFSIKTDEAGICRNTYLNLATITHPTNAQSIYTYEKATRNLGKQGFMEVYRLTSRADKLGSETFNQQTFSYSENDCSGYPSIHDPENLGEDYQYYTSVSEADGSVTTTTFNFKHLPISVEYCNASVVLQKAYYTYDARKQPVQQKIEYFSSGTQAQSFMSITAAEYDSKGNTTASWSAQANGVTTDTEYRTSYTYDSAYGLLLTKTYKTDADTTIEVRNTLDSSKKNIIRTETFRNGVKTACTEYDYDAYGNVIREKRYHDGFSAYDTTEYTYDRNAYLTQEKHTGILTADGAGAASSPGQPAGTITTDYTYDVLGRMTSVTDGSGNLTAYTYDAAGNVTQCTNPDGTFVRYDRDYVGNKLTVTDENGSQLRYTYTPLGLEYETIDMQSGLVMTRKEYDEQSRLCKLSDFVNGAVTEYTYDVSDRILSETVMQDTVILSQTRYAYDDAAESGLYQKVTKTVVGDAAAPSIVTTQYTDKCGNVVKTGQLLNGTEHLDTFAYDYVGNKTLELSAADAARNLPFTAKYEYNENGQVVKAYNAAGQFTTSTYNALGQLIQTTDYAGTPTAYTYDALGRLLSQTVTIEDDITAVSKYEYDGCGNIIREWKPVQAVGTAAEWSKTEYTYNSRKKLISAKQYDGSTLASETAYTYDGVGNMLSMNAGGSTTSYTYDRFGNVLSTTDALGQTETNAYSVLGRLESKTDRNGIATSYTYDALGRVLSVSAGSGDSAQTILYTYTKTGQLRSEENGWQRSTYAYDAIGQLIGTEEVELASLPAVESPVYNITLDANGGTVDPTTLTVSTDESYTLPVPARSGYTFTGWFLGETQILDGTPVQLTGDVTFVAHWAANTYTVTLDANGGTVTPETLSVSTDESYTLPVPARSGYTFTGWFLGETQILDGTPVQLTGDATFVAHWAINTYTVTFDWNYEDNQRTVQVAHGNSCTVPAITRKGYTLTGWLCGGTYYTAGTSVTITENTTFTAQWKANTYTVEYHSNIPSEYDNAPEFQKVVVKTHTYDVVFEILENPFKLEDARFYGWSLSQTGTVKYREGQSVKNLTSENGGTVRLYAVWTDNGGGGEIPVDPPIKPPVEMQIASIALPDSNSKTYTYDLAGNRTSFTLTQNGEVLQSVAYTYDDLNRLTTVSENGAQQAAYTYDTNGNRASLTYANGVTETYRYNKANWIISLENRNNSGLISSYTYTYYASGSQKTKTAADGKVTSYVYDGLNRLVQESETGALTQSYTYDACGNRAAMTVTGTESYAVSYAYDANNRLLTEQKTQGLLTDLTTYAYDADGNLLSKTVLAGNGGAAGSTYAYNTLNQLVSATENQRTAAYAYNTQGIRTTKVTFSTRTDYLLDGANVVGERLNGEYVSYLRGANLISRTSEDGTDFYLFNAHGDVTGLADSTGASARAYDYDAFGVEKDPDPLDENPFRYCGEYFDRETETYYLRARYYDPTIGRFTQQDTHWTTANSIYGDNPQKINEREDKLGLKSYSYAPQITAIMQSGNLYVYCISNPVAYVDPVGTLAFLASLLVRMAVGAIINIATTFIAAKVTGQEVTWLDIGVAAAAGALSASGSKTASIVAGVGAGLYTAIMTYKSGASLGGALAAGAVSGVITANSMSAIGEGILGEGIDVWVSAGVDSVFSVAGNSISAATAKSAPVVSPRKSKPSNSAAVPNPRPKKPNTAPTAPSRAGGSAQKMLMVMY